jgi:preprotein translocase subunit SecA
MITAMSELDADDSLSEEEKMRKQQDIQQSFTDKNERIHNVDQLIRAYCL